ncbi:Dam family site-specific DNA-(adenine-N6)-methyltransferase [Stenotrophomonas sp.]|uniref:DNA adenine methylase n=1 Tax=Stenotrophomonas sp. TaxID=69392 RepID=UPI002852D0AF|nr:Dam family site-specific DNA-(adenine-N6)-methyltransferase [Stenotrophomonas sp.]
MSARGMLARTLHEWAGGTSARKEALVTCTPFLKWAGGKRWLSPLAPVLREFAPRRYFEPFLGSGAMYFALQPSRAVLSDANASLIETYVSIRDDWQSVWRHLTAHDRQHCDEYYYRVREMVPRTAATRAAQFIYLNRTCWNGLYRVNRSGRFNVPVGSKSRALLDTDNFALTASVLSAAQIRNDDFADVIAAAGAGDLIFADPPYTVRHQFNGFVKYNQKLFSWDDQVRLCRALEAALDRGASVVCTNADHTSIRELYGERFGVIGLSRFSSIAGRGGSRGSYAEVLIYGQGAVK